MGVFWLTLIDSSGWPIKLVAIQGAGYCSLGKALAQTLKKGLVSFLTQANPQVIYTPLQILSRRIKDTSKTHQRHNKRIHLPILSSTSCHMSHEEGAAAEAAAEAARTFNHMNKMAI